MADLSPLRQKLGGLADEIRPLLDTFTDRAPLWRGLVYRLRRRCGKKTCCCTQGELHETTVLSDRSQGPQRVVSLSLDEILRIPANLNAHSGACLNAHSGQLEHLPARSSAVSERSDASSGLSFAHLASAVKVDLALPPRLALEFDPVGLVNDPIHDRVRDRRVPDRVVPVLHG